MNDLLSSKKFWITGLGMLCLTACFIFGTLPVEFFSALFTVLCGSYAISQGIADKGKVINTDPNDVPTMKQNLNGGKK